MADRTITLDLIGRDRSMSRTMDKAGDSAVKNGAKVKIFGKDADDMSKKVAAGSLKFQKFNGALALGVTAIVHTVAAGQQLVATSVALSGTLGVLPGVAAGAAIGVATVKLAVHGLDTAFKETDPAKYAADLKALSPAAAQFVKDVKSQQAALTGLQKGTQQSFFARISGDIQPLISRDLPLLKSGFQTVADSLGGAADKDLLFLSSASGHSDVANIMTNAGKASTYFANALTPIIPDLLKLTSISSNYLPGIAKGFDTAAQKADGFIARITTGGKDSTFAHWIDTGITEIHKLSGEFKSLADGASNPALKQDAVQIFSAMKSAAADVDKELPLVVQAVEKLAPALANLVKDSGGAFGSSLHLYASAAVELAPALTAVTKALGPFAPLLGAVVPLLYVGAKGIQAWSAIKPVITAVKEWTVAQTALDLVLDANPIALVVIGIAALTAVIILAWKNSQTFRAVMITVFKAVADEVLGAISFILGAFGSLFGVLGHLPGKAGAPFRAVAGAIKSAKAEVDKFKHSVDDIPTKKVLTFDVRYKGPTVIDGQRIAGGAGSSRGGLTFNAAGGPVYKGVPTVVGDGGRPELFVPKSDGQILPSVPTTGQGMPWVGGAASVAVHVHLTSLTGTLTRQQADQVADVVAQAFAKRGPGGRRVPSLM